MKKVDSPLEKGPKPRAQVTAGRLDLDHPCPEIGEEHRGVGRRDQIAELNDEDAVQGDPPQTRSMTVLIPWPTPMHMVASPYRPLRRTNSWVRVVTSPGSRCPERMADGDGPTVDVHPLRVDLEQRACSPRPGTRTPR